MAFALMGLGPHKFYIPALHEDTPNFQSINRDTSYSWTAQPRLGRDLAMQFTGPSEDVISVEGVLYPFMFGGVKTIAALRESGRAGKPLDLVRYYGFSDPSEKSNSAMPSVMMGSVLGKYVIRRVRTAETKIGSIGAANKIEFTIELAFFGEDQTS